MELSCWLVQLVQLGSYHQSYIYWLNGYSVNFHLSGVIFRHASVSSTYPCKSVRPSVSKSHFWISNLWSPFCAAVVFDDPTAMLLGSPPSPRRSTPSPRRSTPSPRRSTPSPRRSTPSTRRSTPSPRRLTPSPRTFGFPISGRHHH